MKSIVYTETLSWPGIKFDCKSWFCGEEVHPSVIDAFMHLCVETWHVVNGDTLMVMTLDGEDFMLYLFSPEIGELREWVARFEEYAQDFNERDWQERLN